MKTTSFFYCCSKTVDSSNPDEGNKSFSRQKLWCGMSIERFTTRCSNYLVESKQANH